MLYGSYPAVVTDQDFARKTVTELVTDNLYKDVLELGEIIKTDKLNRILQALAFQIGNQVSINEIAGLVEIDNKTVSKYIALMEQAFIIFRLPSFKRNLRNELKASQKIYFYDVGIRNAVINDFRPLDVRQDVGQLFENYIISEYMKLNEENNLYFWRNRDQQEVDLLSEKDGEISAIEIKYNPKKNYKFPKSFIDEYSPANTDVVNSANYVDYLLQ